MNIKQCLEVGLECNLTMVQEAMDNVVVHRMNIFVYDRIQSEVNELFETAKNSNITSKMMISEALELLK